jgi:hypothetical protein
MCITQQTKSYVRIITRWPEELNSKLNTMLDDTSYNQSNHKTQMI